jgi:hypothetical protein
MDMLAIPTSMPCRSSAALSFRACGRSARVVAPLEKALRIEEGHTCPFQEEHTVIYQAIGVEVQHALMQMGLPEMTAGANTVKFWNPGAVKEGSAGRRTNSGRGGVHD